MENLHTSAAAALLVSGSFDINGGKEGGYGRMLNCLHVALVFKVQNNLLKKICKKK